MQAEDGTLIPVQREWNGWRRAQVRLDDLRDVHWFQPEGAPRPLVHGNISCADIVDGDIPHDCSLTKGPHRLHVCVLKRHTIPTVHAKLARRADERQHSNLRPPAWKAVLLPSEVRARATTPSIERPRLSRFGTLR